MEYSQYRADHIAAEPEASPPQKAPPKSAPLAIGNQKLKDPIIRLDAFRKESIPKKQQTELVSVKSAMKNLPPASCESQQRDWPRSIIYKDDDICVSTMKDETVKGVIDIDSYLIMSTIIRSFNDMAVFTILNEKLFYKDCENVKALKVLADHVSKMKTNKKLYGGLQFVEGHLANYGDDQIHVVFAVDERAMNHNRTLPNYMKFYVNKVVIPAIKSLPKNTETILRFNDTKPKIHVFHSEIEAFEKELEKRTRGYINGDQWLLQIFFYKAHHNMKSNKSIGLKEIQQSIKKDPHDILFIQVHTGCVISHEHDCVLFDYDRIREVSFFGLLGLLGGGCWLLMWKISIPDFPEQGHLPK
ncbi:hypothetical protein TKK_0007168 [Trichogramma kaykai]|uniref:Uncharacterized protein n=1 Tax=Trichogramma kaykai TaxID=54128 RepID=A0ABD2XA16_9HYME